MTIVETRTPLDRARDAGTARPLELRHEGGWWVGELESDATMTAQHLCRHHMLGLRTLELDRKIANELRARQNEDGASARTSAPTPILRGAGEVPRRPASRRGHY